MGVDDLRVSRCRGIATVTLLPVAALSLAGALVSYRLELSRQSQQLAVDARMSRELLRSELERHRLLPTTLAADPSLSIAIRGATTAEAHRQLIEAMNRRLEGLSRYDGAATLYLIRADGVTVASSNYASPRSFVGQNYSSRNYFVDAMQEGSGRLFAEGTVSRIPGLYLAERLSDLSGVVVVKIEFGGLEKTWSQDDELTVVTDQADMVVLTSVADLRFKQRPQPAGFRWISSSLPTENAWTLHMDRDVGDALVQAALIGATIAGLITMLAGMGFGRVRLRAAEGERIRAALTEEVSRRTAELRESNERLLREIDERNQSEAKMQKLRNDLINANKLAVLGQISAGVAHEINQPVAAIRGYVDNARVLLSQGDLPSVAGNLDVVTGLTDRIGLITRELLTFSRQTPGAPEPVRVNDAIDGALSLLRPLLRASSISLQRIDADPGLTVSANRIRLEQVLMNLLQNASEAVSDSAYPRVNISSGTDDLGAWIEIEDNGPGIPPEQLESLFTPFATTKKNGLGLGLVICRDILAAFGGSLEYRAAAISGARFRIRLGTC